MPELTDTSSRLSPEFFSRSTLAVAPDLIGKLLVSHIDGQVTAGRIVETEAYCGDGDAASHASRRMTPRNAVMFGDPGRAYVYFSYGMHYLFNIVTESRGMPGAALIRAIEPISGTEVMMHRRSTQSRRQLCNGPGKLTGALGITLLNNTDDLSSPMSAIGIFDDGHTAENITAGPRIGISSATDLPWRYCLSGSTFLSRP